MFKSVTMVMSNKILSRGHSLLKLNVTKKGIEKRNSKINILLNLSKLKNEFKTQSDIKNEPFAKTFYDFMPLNFFEKNLHLWHSADSKCTSEILKC